MAGKAGRSGPKKGAMNALKTGAGIARTRLVVGELPKQLLSVRREGRSYRRALESAVLNTRSEITATLAHHIDTASAATIHAGICRWLLRNKIATMTTADILACSRELIKAKQARDAAVKLLELDVQPEPIDLKTYLIQGNNDAGHHHGN
jgi:hypothetical protein